MSGFLDLLRAAIQWRFRLRGLATITDIGPAVFDRLLLELESDQWKVVARYAGIDAGIDYDCVRLKRDGVRLKCEWDPWGEWSVEGPASVLRAIADRFKLTAQARWRWAG
ncbi:MAG TPA: hypothetical protein VIN35_14560 [Hydrogenophaga sp.]